MTDQPTLDRDKSLIRLKGDAEFLQLLYRTFLEDVEGRRQRLTKALSDEDLPTLQRQAHSLKGAAGTIDAPAMREAALSLETASREGDLEQARRTHTLVMKQLAELEQAIHAALGD